MPDGRILRALGVLSIVTALPLIGEGMRAAGPLIRLAVQRGMPMLYVKALLSSTGAAAAWILLVAGIALCAKYQWGQLIAFWSCAVLVPVGIVGVLIGLLGGHGTLAEVGLPTAILLLVRATDAYLVPLGNPEALPRRPTTSS